MTSTAGGRSIRVTEVFDSIQRPQDIATRTAIIEVVADTWEYSIEVGRLKVAGYPDLFDWLCAQLSLVRDVAGTAPEYWRQYEQLYLLSPENQVGTRKCSGIEETCLWSL